MNSYELLGAELGRAARALRRRSSRMLVYLLGWLRFFGLKCMQWRSSQGNGRLGVSYTLFDGEELLEDSIRSIRASVEHISVVYQLHSHWGSPHPNALFMDILLDLRTRGLVDELIEYNPMNSGLPEAFDASSWHSHDVVKRNMGLAAARRQGCTHFMSLDSDEIYVPEEFAYMRYVLTRDSHEPRVGAVQHLQYWRSNEFRKAIPEQEFVTTIFPIHEETRFIYGYDAPIPIDPGRKPNISKYRVFMRYEVQMRHMSFVRRDLSVKLRNHGARNDIASVAEGIASTYASWKWPQPGRWASGELIPLKRIKPVVDIRTFLQEDVRKSEGS